MSMYDERNRTRNKGRPPEFTPDIGRSEWKLRRRVVAGTLFFCGGSVLYLMIFGPDDNLRTAIANGLVLLAGSVVTGYVFGAVWDDKNYRDSINQNVWVRQNINTHTNIEEEHIPDNYVG